MSPRWLTALLLLAASCGGAVEDSDPATSSSVATPTTAATVEAETAPEQQARWVRASNYFPVRKSTARALTGYLEQNPHYGVAFDMLDYGKSEPTLAGYQQVRRLVQEAMVEAIEGGDIGEILRELQRKANRTIN